MQHLHNVPSLRWKIIFVLIKYLLKPASVIISIKLIIILQIARTPKASGANTLANIIFVTGDINLTAISHLPTRIQIFVLMFLLSSPFPFFIYISPWAYLF